MAKKCDAKKQVRLDGDVYGLLVDIKEKCGIQVTIGALANCAIKRGLLKGMDVTWEVFRQKGER